MIEKIEKGKILDVCVGLGRLPLLVAHTRLAWLVRSVGEGYRQWGQPKKLERTCGQIDRRL